MAGWDDISAPVGDAWDAVSAPVAKSNKKRKPNKGSDVVKSYVTGLNESLAGVADMVAGSTLLAPLSTLARMSDKNPFGVPLPTATSPNVFARFAEKSAHKPQTTEGEVARTAGQMTPNVFAPGSAGARVANVVAPTIGAEVAGRLGKAEWGERGEVVGRTVGALAGGVAAAARPQNLIPRRGRAGPVETFAERARPDPAAMQTRARDMRAAGVQPTLVDVSGERGRRVIRAVGVRGEAAGEALTEAAQRTSAATKPASIAATRRLTPDRRTATQFADEMEATRGATAADNYRPFDANPIDVPDTVRDMLADASGRAIIARARADAIENQDWGRQVELDRLLRAGDPGGVGPLPRISAGTIDRLVIAARERGANFARRGNGNRARGAFGRRAQLDATLDGVEGLRPARQTYSNQSRAIEVARGEGRLDPFSTDPTDYGAWLNGLPAEARQANQVAVRQELLDTLGGQRSSTFGTLDELATSPYARDNLRLAFGPEVADRYIGEIAARLQQTRNTTFVQPNAGSRTAVLENDVKNAAQQVVGATRQGLSGDLIGLAARAVDAWRSRGIRPEVAERLARIATDPSQTDDAIRAIAARLEPQAREAFISLRQAAAVSALPATVAATAER